ncbi:hypothetical protein DL766_003412 [Monosporascus sp. MC13-8B]|uniref:Myocyte-specific enhancer factor 2d n=1 Tax=Monosporascus cannonballus TaxID=155416 RepID=A0ABY0HG97_9PEZI|nr:hypothetical protein DL763_011562 [Monosporascus cannonballus]RYO92762.1 hypothetical protein DL762_001468 [Monosporascus cannonballus]RYP33492.1 hypothetical protein DL766_003412 [Monosporascus sp. MC13-8B]
MTSTLKIPGYYYDEEKKKYFKIEKSNTAPSNAVWSSDSVKKRRLEDEEAAKAIRRMTLDKSRVARAKILNHPLAGGFLDCEFGRPRPDVASAGFAEGLVDKGKLLLKDARWTSASNVNHMYIDGQDRNTDMCVAFARSIVGFWRITRLLQPVSSCLLSFLCTLPFNDVMYNRTDDRIAPYHELAVPQISDIKYHQPSNQVLVTSRSPSQDVVIWAFTPKETDASDTRPRWLLGWSGNSVYRRINTQGDLKHHDYQANSVVPAPENSNQVCAIGTNRGVVRWVADGYRVWLTPRSFPPKERNPYTDIFSLDFQRVHPDILMFGGRPGKMWIGDHRQPQDKWDIVSASSSITHIRSVNEHQVLIAGLRDKLSVYDLRFRKNKSGDTSTNGALPVLTFPQYRNRAHINIGLDFDGPSGVVAAAHEDGKVALYSVYSGNRLRSPDVDTIHSPRGPIQCIQYQTFPRDNSPTLFVGAQSNINAYSFGVRSLQDEA